MRIAASFQRPLQLKTKDISIVIPTIGTEAVIILLLGLVQATNSISIVSSQLIYNLVPRCILDRKAYFSPFSCKTGTSRRMLSRQADKKVLNQRNANPSVRRPLFFDRPILAKTKIEL